MTEYEELFCAVKQLCDECDVITFGKVDRALRSANEFVTTLSAICVELEIAPNEGILNAAEEWGSAMSALGLLPVGYMAEMDQSIAEVREQL